MRAAIYARVSTPEQAADGNGLESQIAACRAYAASHDYEVVAIYREVRTGRDLAGRKQLADLRARVKAGDLDLIVVHAIDRLTRNVAHLHFLITEAEAAGATIAFVTEALVDTPEGKLLQAVRGFVAELERLKTGERSRLGIRTRVERGHYHVGSIPYGYQWRDTAHDALVPEVTTAPIIERIFTAVARGTSIRQLITLLDADGIPTPRHSHNGWNERTVAEILRNPIYKGMPHAYRWRKKSRGDLADLVGGGRETWEPAPVADWVPFPAAVAPPLVSVELWTAANAWRVANRPNAPVDHPLPETFLLAGGLARCGICGRPLLGRGRTARRPYYRCASRRADHFPCARVHSLAVILDDRVWTRVLRTAARGGPPLGRHPDTAGKLVWLDDPDPTSTRESLPLGLTDVAEALRQFADGDTEVWHQMALGVLADRVRQSAEADARSDRALERFAVLQTAWTDLIDLAATDPFGLDAAPFAMRRAWLERLGIVVRVWPRGYGRLLEVMSAVDPDAVPREDLPTLTPQAASRVTKQQLLVGNTTRAEERVVLRERDAERRN